MDTRTSIGYTTISPEARTTSHYITRRSNMLCHKCEKRRAEVTMTLTGTSIKTGRRYTDATMKLCVVCLQEGFAAELCDRETDCFNIEWIR